MTQEAYHYPPELMALLKETVPKLCRSKRDLLTFFRGCGVPSGIMQPHEQLLANDKESFNKYHVTADLLEKINQLGDSGLKLRRELLKRVTEFEDFSVCWERDQSAARGLVSQVRDLVNVKDSFTRMRNEKDEEKRKRIEREQAETALKKAKAEKIDVAKIELFALFGEKNEHVRGKKLEGVLAKVFDAYDIPVKGDFSVKSDSTGRVIEQIDGQIELDGHIYLTEMKWHKDTIGTGEIAPHLVRLYGRGGQARAFFISYSPFSEAAITQCKEALVHGAVVCLVLLEEIVEVISAGADLKQLLRKKAQAAVTHKNPLFRDVA